MLLKDKKKTLFSPRKGQFCLFLSVSLCFSLAFFGLPLFQFLFLCLSRALFFLFAFLSLFFAFFLFLIFLSFLPFLSSLLLFHERNNIKTLNCYFFLKSFLFLFVSCLAFSFPIPFSYRCFFPEFKLFFVQHQCFWFQKTKLNTPIFGQKGACNITFFFFMNLCFAKCEKLSFFLAIFCPILVDGQKTL